MADDFREHDPRIDAYIAQAPDFARPVLERLRALVHAALPEARETIRWSRPHFTVEGRLLAGMSAFKAHCAFMIHGAGRLGGPLHEYGRIASLADLPDDAEVIDRLRGVAQKRASSDPSPRAGRVPRPEIPLPEDFVEALAMNPAAQSTFDGFSPSNRRDYLEWITEAKQPATRARRIAQSVAWLAEGKRRHWKHQAG